MTTAVEAGKAKRVKGGSFLIEDLGCGEIFTPEDFSEEQVQIADMATAFAEEKILAKVQAIEAKDFEVSKTLMRELGELGLLGIDAPEEYGGLALDKVTSALVTDKLSIIGSFATTFSAHVTIGTLPLIWYGTKDQKDRYLAKLVTGEWIASYALSESSAGSDAMNIRTKARLSEDGKHYILNGEKMWITNAGFASLFTVFAKIDGEQFSAFLIERGTEGFSVGKEEHKLGIRGSSTCPLILNDCKIPVENLLGTAGKGHQIAFNILNVGRYKLAASAIRGSSTAFRDGVRYAKNRVGFGKPITAFGLVQKKIADTAAEIYATESVVYRVIGAIDAALAELDSASPAYYQQVQKCIEEFAAECSILKFACSEILDRAVDQMLQLHGGYGYVEEFPAERSYRDARINKIYEGTNEINRLITTGWLIKRALKGELDLMPAIQKVTAEVESGQIGAAVREGKLGAEFAQLAVSKKIALFCLGVASARFGNDLSEQQEVMGALAEVIAEVLLLDSTLLRTEKISGRKPMAAILARHFTSLSFMRVKTAAERVLGATAENEAPEGPLATLRRLTALPSFNTVTTGRAISAHMVEAGQYTL
jgi:alkylation response protein AidB-like acyl-CoA dehydrogenase